ncbi:hypothetical protein ABT173_20775 [Streptomyces sp. NPDC001795]|uniref:hypothetical protein n=1 Tax=unclassified Streptomyces TaxID=2593676 RepID=UPI00331D7126
MRTTPVLRRIAAALFTGGVITAVAAGTATAATVPTHSALSGAVAAHQVSATVSHGGYGPCSGWGNGYWWDTGWNDCGWNGNGFYGGGFYDGWNSWNPYGSGFVVIVGSPWGY